MSSYNAIHALNEFNYDKTVFKTEFEKNEPEMFEYIIEEYEDFDGLETFESSINHLDMEMIKKSLQTALVPGEVAFLQLDVEGNSPEFYVITKTKYIGIDLADAEITENSLTLAF